MTVLDLSAYKPVADTEGDADQVANAFTALEALINGNIDAGNLAAGVVGAKTGATVGGLGTPSAGTIGLVRAGTTPYDFGHVIYDATLGKFVSAPIVAYSYADSSSLSLGGSSSYTNVTGSKAMAHTVLPWKALNTAGLKWQFRWDAYVTWAASTSSFGLRLTVSGADLGGTRTQDTTHIFGESTSFTANATQAISSGWVDLNASISVTDTLILIPQAHGDGTRVLTFNPPGALTVMARLVA